MNTPALQPHRRGALELIEEAVHLLRRRSARALANYYLGSVPFVLGLLFYGSDMRQNAFADEHLALASLALAIGFLWMKFWQAVFAQNLRAQISLNPGQPWTIRRCLRAIVIQTAIQTTGLIFVPLSVIAAAIPFPWVYAFYQNVSALTDTETADVIPAVKNAYRQCIFWPRQNVAIVIVLYAFGFCVFLNLVTVGLIMPGLAKTFLGIDSAYTDSPMALLNSTFLACVTALAYLCVDPIIKAVYVLRCFYSESVRSGEDLQAELKRYAPLNHLASLAIAALLCLLGARSLSAADAPNSAISTAVSGEKLDHAIEEVIHQPKYAWRLPRAATTTDDTEGPIGRFLDSTARAIGDSIRTVWRGIRELFDRWTRSHPSDQSTTHSTGDWIGPLQVFFFVIVIAAVCALVVFIIRAIRQRQGPSAVAISQAILPAPDLADENVGAELLPEDAWTKLARELLARGELRLALRAFYFASLAHLAARSLITIARFKSNREYENELRRRAHALPALMPLFNGNLTTFERGWYGRHEVDVKTVEVFAANVERLKASQ